MLIEESEKGLKLLVCPCEEAELRAMPEDVRNANATLYELISARMLERFGLCWVTPTECGIRKPRLIIGRREWVHSSGWHLVDVFGFTDYVYAAPLRSPLEDLAWTGEAFFERG